MDIDTDSVDETMGICYATHNRKTIFSSDSDLQRYEQHDMILRRRKNVGYGSKYDGIPLRIIILFLFRLILFDTGKKG